MAAGLIEHLPWICALIATLAALEMLRRLRLTDARYRDLLRDHQRVNLSLDLAEAVGRMGSWQYSRTEASAFWSDELFTIHGRARHRGQPLLTEAISYFHPDERVRVAEIVRRSIAQGEDFELRGRIITDNGVQKEVLVRSTCRYDRDGTTLGVIGYMIDLGVIE